MFGESAGTLVLLALATVLLSDGAREDEADRVACRVQVEEAAPAALRAGAPPQPGRPLERADVRPAAGPEGSCQRKLARF